MTLRDDISQRYGVPAQLLTADTYDGMTTQAEALTTWRDTAPSTHVTRTTAASGNDIAPGEQKTTIKDRAMHYLIDYTNGN